jgi:hypothetical protein
MAVTIRIRRATSLEWSTSTRILQLGELAVDTTLNKLKVGTGNNTFAQLPFLNVLPSELSEIIQDNIASFIVGGTGIETSYVDNGDGSGTLTLSVDETIADKEYVDDAIFNLGNNVDSSYVPISQKGNPDGVATLDPDGFIPDSEIPSSITRDSELESHNDATTDVHGISDTSLLLTTAGGTLTGYLTLHADPTNSLHAATKEYVDNVSTGILSKPSVIAATTESLDATYDNGTLGAGATLTSNTNGSFPLIDGATVTTTSGQRGVLVKNQSNAAHNGRYNLTTQGDTNTPWVLTKCGLCDTANEVPGSYIFVTDGTLNGQTGWVLHVEDPATFVVGQDAVSAYQFSGSGTYTAGSGLSLDGTQFSADSTIARLESPTFTGTVSGISKSMVGLGNVDNTSDENKPVSAAVQTELDKKTDELYIYVPVSTSTTASSTSHKYKMIHFTNTSSVVLTLPNETTDSNWEVGSSFEIRQMATGFIEVQAEVPATLVSPENHIRTRVQYSSLYIEKIAPGQWIMTGDTVAS